MSPENLCLECHKCKKFEENLCDDFMVLDCLDSDSDVNFVENEKMDV